MVNGYLANKDNCMTSQAAQIGDGTDFRTTLLTIILFPSFYGQ
jgi:hypothetical protein